MKQISLLKVYEWGLLAVMFLIVLHAPISVGVGHFFPDLSLVAKAWKEIVLAVLSVIGVVLVTRQKRWREILNSPFVTLSILFIDIHLLLALIMRGDTQSIVAGLMIDLRFIVMFLLMYVLVLMNPAVVKRVVKVIAAGAAVVIGFGLLQILVLPDDVLKGIGYSNDTIVPFMTVDTNHDFIRINSTLRGPNPLGALMVIYGSLAIAYAALNRRNLQPKLAAGIVGGLIGSVAVLFSSYSRSAYLAAIAAFAGVFAFSRKISVKAILLITVAGLVVAVTSFFIAQTSWFSNVILHENPESMVKAKSNEDHVLSVVDGGKRVASQPFGAGIGSTGSASLYDGDTSNDTTIENAYLFVAHESGWFGLAVFLVLFGLIMVRLWRHRKGNWLIVGIFSGGIGMAIIGLLLPVWVDDTVAIIWWGLAGMAIASISSIMKSGNAKGTRKQKTTRTA